MKHDTSLPTAAETHRLINSRQLRQICPVSLMSFWRWEACGKWPKRIKIHGRNFWRLSEVLAAIDEMTTEGRREDGK